MGALLGGATPKSAASNSGISAVPASAPAEGVRRVGLDQIRHSAFQPRKDFPQEALQELADSIKQQGIIQPLVVREKPDHFELIAGERRWRAA
ncbi:MAG TPA: ParB/RepB/Spo0J family partition protein, partial [Verrucomicrobiae bacterium]|nr:ParB/RepB/Spo0J family partition protein [Verrucomicrobiae bacterium]